MARTKSNINLAVTFHATAETPRLRAVEIAEKVRLFLAMDMDLADVRVEVHGAALDYTEAYEAERDALAFGNPATDALN